MASFNAQDKHYMALNTNDKPLNMMEKTLLETTWEKETEYDVAQAHQELKEIKKLKKYCLVKLFTWLPEAFIANIFYAKKENQLRRSLNKIYYKFLFNKINYTNFKKQLLKLSKDDILFI